MRFIIGLLIGFGITRVILNPILQKNKIYLEKEKEWKQRAKQTVEDVSQNVDEFIKLNYPGMRKEERESYVEEIVKSDNAIT